MLRERARENKGAYFLLMRAVYAKSNNQFSGESSSTTSNPKIEAGDCNSEFCCLYAYSNDLTLLSEFRQTDY